MDTVAIYERVIERFGGSPAKLAEALSERGAATVCNWRARGIPPNRAKAIEALTGISVRELRPLDWQEYWPDADTAKAA